MQYRVDELAIATGIKVDTIRFYQGKGLIPRPTREGRNAIYHEPHFARIQQIRNLLEEGFSLAQIKKLPAPGEAETDTATATATATATDTDTASEPAAVTAGGDREALLRALAQERVSDRSLRRAELAARAGVPEELVTAAQTAGLLEPTEKDGEAFFSMIDLDMLETGLSILGAGLPLTEFLALASEHDQNIRAISERGIDLFDDHIRKQPGNAENPEAVARAFREIMPRLTRLVALHFQRTLVQRAIERLRAKGEGPALERALASVEATHLEGGWQR